MLLLLLLLSLLVVVVLITVIIGCCIGYCCFHYYCCLCLCRSRNRMRKHALLTFTARYRFPARVSTHYTGTESSVHSPLENYFIFIPAALISHKP